jgi:hypothetical protein
MIPIDNRSMNGYKAKKKEEKSKAERELEPKSNGEQVLAATTDPLSMRAPLASTMVTRIPNTARPNVRYITHNPV